MLSRRGILVWLLSKRESGRDRESKGIAIERERESDRGRDGKRERGRKGGPVRNKGEPNRRHRRVNWKTKEKPIEE